MAESSACTEYDVVLDATILTDIGKQGWQLKLTSESATKVFEFIQKKKQIQKGEALLSESEVKELSESCFSTKPTEPTICAFGAFNKGKTTTLNLISGNKFGTGKLHSTEGLSIKLPSAKEQSGIVLDVAGSNTPISAELMRQTEEELKDNLDYKNAKTEEEKTKIIRKRAIVNKKTNEQVLMDLVFSLADVILFVVNEMTWQEQQSIEVLREIIAARTAESKKVYNKEKKITIPSIIVVHNYHLSTDLKNFSSLKQKFVFDCYEGELQKQKINVENQNSIELEVLHSGEIRHVFLGCHHSVATKSEPGVWVNPATIQYLKDALNMSFVPNQGPYLSKLKEKVTQTLSKYFVGGLKKMNYVYNVDKKTLYLRGTPNETGTPLRLIRDQLEFDGLSLVVGSSEFRPEFDVFYDAKVPNLKRKGQLANNMMILMDVPGINSQTKNSFRISPKDDRIMIQGTKELFYFPMTPEFDPKLAKPVPIPRNTSSGDKDPLQGPKILLNEFKEGKFVTTFEIPQEFDAEPDSWKYCVHNGVAQIILPFVADDD